MCVILILFLNISGKCTSYADQSEGIQSSEYKIKAVYLYNFLKFTDFNRDESQDSSDIIRITILGNDPFGDSFAPLEGKAIKGKSLQVTRIDDINAVKKCDLLYICNSENSKLKHIIGELGNTGILTVGETTEFTELGGIISFFMEDEIVQFSINIPAAENAGIEFSTQLLQLGRIIK